FTSGCSRPNGADRKGIVRSGSIVLELLGAPGAHRSVRSTHPSTLPMSTIGLGVEQLTKLAKPGVGGGQSGVHAGVKQDFGELVQAHPVTAGAAQVHS